MVDNLRCIVFGIASTLDLALVDDSDGEFGLDEGRDTNLGSKRASWAL